MTATAAVPDGIKPYLEYLDKEMTIMGVISAFCVGASALVIERAAAAAKGTPLSLLWNSGRTHLVLGSACLLAAALFFYRQRSLLAFYYGQICLSVSPYQTEVASTYDGLKEVDSWATWLHYRRAFGFVSLGFFDYGLAVARTPVPRLGGWPDMVTIYIPAAAAVVTVVTCAIHTLVLARHRYSESRWAEAVRHLRRGRSTRAG